MSQCEYGIFLLDRNNISDVKANEIVNKLVPNKSYVLQFQGEMDKSNWRELLLQELHALHGELGSPSHFMFPDEDEIMPIIKPDFQGQMMFNYKMVTEKGSRAYRYPYLPHAKAFSYHTDLSYHPYFHQARISKNGKMVKQIFSTKKVKHFCFYKQTWKNRKEASILERYPDYFDKFPKEYDRD